MKEKKVSVKDQCNINFTNHLMDALKKEVWKENPENEELDIDVFALLIVGLTRFKQKYPTKYGEIKEKAEEKPLKN